jgi:hypothetical protein
LPAILKEYKEESLSDLFLGTCLSMYAELQQQRKEVLRAYSAG